jgi:hypothetical protein
MKTLKFRVTAKVSKIVEVEVDDEGMSPEEVENKGRELAHENFNILNDDNEESYSEDSELIVE